MQSTDRVGLWDFYSVDRLSDSLHVDAFVAVFGLHDLSIMQWDWTADYSRLVCSLLTTQDCFVRHFVRCKLHLSLF